MARVIVFCGHCASSKGWNRVKPPMRTTNDPCDVCGGHESYRRQRQNPRTGAIEIEVVPMKNFQHDARFLPGEPEETRLQDPLA